MDEYYIRYVPLPVSLKGITVEDAAGFYNIYINSLLSYEEQQKAIKHELTHVLRNDFDQEKPLQLVEAYRPARAIPVLESEKAPAPPIRLMPPVTEPKPVQVEKPSRPQYIRRRFVNINIWADELDMLPTLAKQANK